MKLDAGTLAAGYEALFDPLTREDGWPTVQACQEFARVFGVPGAELAAFFGFVGMHHDGRTIWVDALHGPVTGWTARQQASKKQAVALGFTQAAIELPA